MSDFANRVSVKGRKLPVGILPPEEVADSDARHASTCRWYGNTKGRECRKDEGKACKVCGG